MDSGLATKINTMLPLLDEKQKRIFLALEANAIGRGGVKLVHEITGLSQTTIIRGKKEIEEGGAKQHQSSQVRRRAEEIDGKIPGHPGRICCNWAIRILTGTRNFVSSTRKAVSSSGRISLSYLWIQRRKN
jgi:hypothetical protein